MTSSLYVHTPAQLLKSRMPFLLNRNLQPEVACQDVSIEQLDFSQIRDCAEQLSEQQLKTTVHAPFSGFNPGNSKKRVRKVAHSMCQQSLQLAEALNARCLVFHPGIPYKATQKVQDLWLENALGFWPEYIAQARQIETVICIENIYETSSNIFLSLFAELGTDNFGHCFDIGHWNIFSEQNLEDWFNQVGSHIKHLHLHDNHGKTDQHLPLGAGGIDFPALFKQVTKRPINPSMTLEAHKLPELEISLEKIQTYLQ